MKKNILFILLISFNNIYAVTNYVWNGSSSPSSPYTSWATAAHSIQDAVNAAVEGNIVLVTNGVYSGLGYEETRIGECVFANNKNIVLKSVNGWDGTIIDGENTRRCIFSTNGVIYGFTLRNGLGGGPTAWYYGSFRRFRFGGGAFFYFDGLMRNSVIISNSVWNATAGVRFYGGGRLENSLVIFNNAQSRGGGIGTRFGGTIINCTIARNIDQGGSSGGVYCQDSGTFINNIIYDNSGGNVGNSAAGFFSYCCSPNSLAGTGNITGNPRFVDSGAGDFHLRFDSAAIDKGDTAMAPLPTDLDGSQRVQCCSVDIGCYEKTFTESAALLPPVITSPTFVPQGGIACAMVTNQTSIVIIGTKSNGVFVINSCSTNNIIQSYDNLNWTNINVELTAVTNYFRFRTISNDFETISAGTTTVCVIVHEAEPFINITNAPANVDYSTGSADVSGTNSISVAGDIVWSNITANIGGVASRIAPENLAWVASSISLNHGDNQIAVYGSNLAGQLTNDVVIIHRKTWDEVAPRIATNALIFPSMAAVILAPLPTNIIWDVSRITDETDQTNLTITKISVHLASNSNEVATVTNDISNLLGEIGWQVPESIIGGATNYVIRFEVVNSLSLTNCRIFSNNEFIVVPECGGVLLFGFFILFYLKKGKL